MLLPFSSNYNGRNDFFRLDGEGGSSDTFSCILTDPGDNSDSDSSGQKETVISCNGQILTRTSADISPSRCNPTDLVADGILHPNIEGTYFGCPRACFGGAGGISDCSATATDIAIYTVQSEYDQQLANNGLRVGGISCQIADDRGGTGTFGIAVSVRDTIWPVVRDFLVEQESFLSNDTEEATANEGDFQSTTSLGGGFVVTVSTRTRVIAVADQERGGSFLNGNYDENNPQGAEIINNASCPIVEVGGVRAEIISCTANTVTFFTPLFRELCSNASSVAAAGESEECGYHTVSISNRQPMIFDGDGVAPLFAAGRVVCPGACPIQGLGFFYTPQCLGFRTPQDCSTSDGDSQQGCAFGAGDVCEQCPDNAICPGGFRAWPIEGNSSADQDHEIDGDGYWSASEDVGSVVRCPFPSLVRCRGWNVASSETRCGTGYGGRLCSGCADGFFEQLDQCLECPNDEDEKAMRLGILLMFAVVLFAAVYGCLLYSPAAKQQLHDRSHDGRRESQMRALIYWQAQDFVLWTLLLLQLFSLVVSSGGESTPALNTILAWMYIASFDFQAVGPECFDTKGGAFIREYVIFSVVLAALVVVVFTFDQSPIVKFLVACGRRRRRHHHHHHGNHRGSAEQPGNDHTQHPPTDDIAVVNSVKSLRGQTMRLLVVLYTPSALLSIGSTYCIESNDSDKGTILVSWANPNFEFVLKPYVRHMSWKFPVQMGSLCLLLAASLLELLNYYAQDRGTVSREAVEGFSFVVLVVVLAEIMVLVIAFWFVVYSVKDADYYVEHFMMQRSGGLAKMKGAPILRSGSAADRGVDGKNEDITHAAEASYEHHNPMVGMKTMKRNTMSTSSGMSISISRHHQQQQQNSNIGPTSKSLRGMEAITGRQALLSYHDDNDNDDGEDTREHVNSGVLEARKRSRQMHNNVNVINNNNANGHSEIELAPHAPDRKTNATNNSFVAVGDGDGIGTQNSAYSSVWLPASPSSTRNRTTVLPTNITATTDPNDATRKGEAMNHSRTDSVKNSEMVMMEEASFSATAVSRDPEATSG
eukprot:jgi/Bigna1/145771/aug1.103_g20479